ncbi:MAG: hypothetical protein LC769_04535 [Chloroflexi bacterium]|nr:hypothetical protein [Chloroflexota bacterium]
MTIRRPEPPSPPSEPPSVLLLRAIADLQRDTGAARLHPDDIAPEIRRESADIAPLIRRAVVAGYLVYAAGAVGLSAQGWAWYEWDRPGREERRSW